MLRVYPETVVFAERFGTRLFYHGGGISGFSSVLQIYPDKELAIAVMSNLDLGASRVQSWTVADRLAGIFLK